KTDVIEHRVQPKRIFGIPVVVSPLLKLLVDPHPLSDGRVGKAVAECLWTRPLDRGISRAVARILAELSERCLFRARIPTGRCWRRRKEGRKNQMDSGPPPGVPPGHPR